ncbi:S1C family serine protease [Paenibacillus sp. GCM10012307]|uniref:Trypsin-like peptidase domain-containing protein n=1 Tax=Paenibacillus roseus TaxID=2798579 RepID=A0A934IYN6_9BACL|nr:trypsin-like peptidase domain-containing protein [Paenibacillus roseus]MBJ6361652.1 trypsin-like peptidase domain-containing protein [Paenibacillus roseus]
MSLFDDDFYSTKVSRRVRSKQMESGSRNSLQIRWTPLRIAFTSSFISALAAVLLFGLIFDNGGGFAASKPVSISSLQVMDPYERPIHAAAKIGPAVVSIINEQLASSSRKQTDEESEESPYQTASLGSGVIFEKIGSKARVITNFHVINGAESIKVVLSDGEVRGAKVLGKDQITDLAVLEIDGKGITTVAEIGDSTKLRDGETVIAIGNPLGLGDSLTMGIVSKTRRLIPISLNQDGIYDWEQEVIQIDASINQGNSGGALIDLNGRLIGVNSMKVADYGVEGLGFAIPINNAMPIVESLIEYGKVKRPYIGVYTLDLEQYFAQQAFADSGKKKQDSKDSGLELRLPKEVKRGVIILEAVGPAKKAGLAFNDVIVKLDRQDIGSMMELRKYLYSKKQIGDTIEVTYYRDGELRTASFTLAEITEEED